MCVKYVCISMIARPSTYLPHTEFPVDVSTGHCDAWACTLLNLGSDECRSDKHQHKAVLSLAPSGGVVGMEVDTTLKVHSHL